MAATIHSINLIISDSKVRGGRPTLLGKTIMVEDIVMLMRYQEPTPHGIAEWLNISLAEVHAALAYYYQNQVEIDTSIAQREAIGKHYEEKRIGSRHKPLS